MRSSASVNRPLRRPSWISASSSGLVIWRVMGFSRAAISIAWQFHHSTPARLETSATRRRRVLTEVSGPEIVANRPAQSRTIGGTHGRKAESRRSLGETTVAGRGDGVKAAFGRTLDHRIFPTCEVDSRFRAGMTASAGWLAQSTSSGSPGRWRASPRYLRELLRANPAQLSPSSTPQPPPASSGVRRKLKKHLDNHAVVC